MRILHCVESYFPSVGGMQEVVRQLSERLVQLGHSVTIATRKHPQRNFTKLQGVTIIDFDISGNWTSGIRGEADKYMFLLLNNDFDIITFFAAQQWATDVALPVLGQIRAKKVSVPTGYSGLYQPEYAKYFENMKTWIHGYDMNVYLSDHYRDIDFARANQVANTTIIPNGAAEDEFLPRKTVPVKKELDIPENDFLILHVGSYTGLKGHREAMEIFLRSNIKNATLLMIGNDNRFFREQYKKTPLLLLRKWMGRLRGKRIIFDHFSRDFTVAAYQQADLFLFPSNVECSPLVLFECAAAKLPFLSTDCGNAREIAGWTGGGEILKTVSRKDGFVEADIEASAQQLEKLYRDKDKRVKMGETAFANWRRKFTWEKLSRDYLNLYRQLLEQ